MSGRHHRDADDSVVMVALTRIRYDSRVIRCASTVASADRRVTLYTLDDGSKPFNDHPWVDHRPIKLGRGDALSVRGTDHGTAPKRNRVRPFLSTAKTLVRPLWFLSQVAKAGSGDRPALVYCHDYDTLVIGMYHRLRHGAAVVYDSHEFWADKTANRRRIARLLNGPKRIEGLSMRWIDQMVVVGDGIARLYRDAFRALPAISTIRNIPMTPPQSVCRSTGDASVRLVMVGAISRHRGIEAAIESLTLQPEHVTLTLVGTNNDPTFLDELRSSAEEFGVEHRFHVSPPVDPSELSGHLAAEADVALVLIQGATASYRNAVPNKFFEAVNAGLPVVVSDLPEVHALMADAQAGVAIDRVTPTAVADAVTQISMDLASFAIGARELQARLSWDNEAQKLDALVGAALEARS